MPVHKILRFAILFAAIALVSPLRAQTALSELAYSVDVAAKLGSTRALHNEVILDALTGEVETRSLGNLSLVTEVDALSYLGGREWLFSVSSRRSMAAKLFRPADVIRWDGSTYDLAFDASAFGVPEGVNVDAVTTDGGALLISFDVDGKADDVGWRDEDLLRIDGGQLTLDFDGSAAGIPVGLDVDAVHRLPSGRLLLSFDISGQIEGVRFDDEDIVEYDPESNNWWLAFDGSERFAALGRTDIDAVSTFLSGIFEDGFESGDISRWSATASP